MKNFVKFLGITALVLVIGFGMTACSNPAGGNGDNGDPVIFHATSEHLTSSWAPGNRTLTGFTSSFISYWREHSESYAGLTVTIPDNITVIGHRALDARRTATGTEHGLRFNIQITSVTIPPNVTEIRSRAFADHPIISVTIGAGVIMEAGAGITIVNDAFSGGFVAFYNANGRTAGTYTWPDPWSTDWTLTPQEED